MKKKKNFLPRYTHGFIISFLTNTQPDEDIGGGMTKATNLEDIQGLGGPMTRAKAKKAKEALNLLVTLTQAQVRRKKRPK